MGAEAERLPNLAVEPGPPPKTAAGLVQLPWVAGWQELQLKEAAEPARSADRWGSAIRELERSWQ